MLLAIIGPMKGPRLPRSVMANATASSHLPQCVFTEYKQASELFQAETSPARGPGVAGDGATRARYNGGLYGEKACIGASVALRAAVFLPPQPQFLGLRSRRGWTAPVSRKRGAQTTRGRKLQARACRQRAGNALTSPPGIGMLARSPQSAAPRSDGQRACGVRAQTRSLPCSSRTKLWS